VHVSDWTLSRTCYQVHRVIMACVAYFNRVRPHQRTGQQVHCEPPETATPAAGKILRFPVLNGLHHEYRRVA
jgi:hypothetical protein